MVRWTKAIPRTHSEYMGKETLTYSSSLLLLLNDDKIKYVKFNSTTFHT